MLAQKHSLRWSILLLFSVSLCIITSCGDDKESVTGPAIVDATVSGVVKNAINKDPISNVIITADDLNSTTTNASGEYELGVSTGTRVLTFSASNFIEMEKEIRVTTGASIRFNANLSPVMASSRAIRIILSWNETPTDLDAHLLTPTIGGESYHIYWSDPGSETEPPYAVLDVDETEGFGPETITIHDPQAGTYNYWVHNWSEDALLAGSGAVVEVYGSDGLINRFTAPGSGEQSYWHVFDVVGSTGEIQTVNQMVDVSPGVDMSSYHIVLTWAEEPSDLDAHLLTPSVEGQEYHIYSGNLGASDRAPYVTLNEDVYSGYGPEIISIHSFASGTYTYYVENLSGEPSLTNSEAFISVWDGSFDNLIGSLSVPTSGAGRYWYAFDIDGSTGEFYIVDEITDVTPGGGGSEAEELIYDDGEPEDYLHFIPEIIDGVLASRMSPSGPCRIMSLKFNTIYHDSTARHFNALIYGWTGSEPSSSPAVTITDVPAAQANWIEIDVSAVEGGITSTGTFVVGFGQTNQSVFLGKDDNDNNRSWGIAEGYSWGDMEQTFFIRAVVQYENGAIEELEPSVEPRLMTRECPKIYGSPLSKEAISSLRASILSESASHKIQPLSKLRDVRDKKVGAIVVSPFSMIPYNYLPVSGGEMSEAYLDAVVLSGEVVGGRTISIGYPSEESGGRLNRHLLKYVESLPDH
ncbi:carboxypeptidase regulatory-like domain-containing protein [bacterium]|nr:carboxypeptidase regulatory-like domain-containing protein [bacterium]